MKSTKFDIAWFRLAISGQLHENDIPLNQALITDLSAKRLTGCGVLPACKPVMFHVLISSKCMVLTAEESVCFVCSYTTTATQTTVRIYSVTGICGHAQNEMTH